MGQFVLVAFIVISLISWVINQVNAQNRPPVQRRGAQRGGPQRRNRGVQEEIDDFLKEAAGRRRPAGEGRKPAAGRGRVLSADEIEIVEERPAPRRPAPARAARQKPGAGVSSRQLSSGEQLGSTVRDHVRTHMDERVGAAAEDNLPNAVNQLVTEHLGAFGADAASSTGRTAQSETRRRARQRAAALRTAFRTPGGARNAVLMHEIMSRPRSLRSQRE